MKCCCCCCKPRKAKIHFRVELVPDTGVPAGPFYVHVKRKVSTMAFIIPIGFQAKLTIAPKDAKGNPSKIDGTPVWSTSDPATLTVTADPADPLTAFAVPVGPLATAQAQVSVDADLGAGTKTITGLLDCEIQAGETAVVDIGGVLEPA